MRTNNITTTLATTVPDWNGRVDQTDPIAMASFVSAMPNAETISVKDTDRLLSGAVEKARSKLLFKVILRDGHLTIEPADGLKDAYQCIGGTHASYGNFILLCSVEGSGQGARPRPYFMFWDDDAVWLKAG